MKTISQVAALAGVSVRTLQYYDKIDLLKPSRTTPSGYRFYNDQALQQLQQILFFKELDFQLKEIKAVLHEPEFNQMEAFKKQKELLLLKRKRLDKLIELLSKLEQGEQKMSFAEFDLSEYISVLEQFKVRNTDQVIKHWGSVAGFEEFIRKVKDDESDVAKMAIKQYGSIEKYTEAMKYNMEHFSELMEQADKLRENKDEIIRRNEELYAQLTADMTRAVDSREIREAVSRVVANVDENMLGVDMGSGYWDIVIESYANETVRGVTDAKYGSGASDYIAGALRCYFNK